MLLLLLVAIQDTHGCVYGDCFLVGWWGVLVVGMEQVNYFCKSKETKRPNNRERYKLAGRLFLCDALSMCVESKIKSYSCLNIG